MLSVGLFFFFVGRPSQAGATAAPVDVSRLDFRIGRVVTAKKHPDADSLYVEEGEFHSPMDTL